jgi:hypothetical protein
LAEKYEEKIVQRGIRSGMSYQSSCMDWVAALTESYQHFLKTGELLPFYIPEFVVKAAKERAEKKGEE